MMTNKIETPSWDEYQDIKNALVQLLNKGYTKPMIKTVLEQMRSDEDGEKDNK
jgi:SOS response regulatory protein OraA/RecX